MFKKYPKSESINTIKKKSGQLCDFLYGKGKHDRSAFASYAVSGVYRLHDGGAFIAGGDDCYYFAFGSESRAEKTFGFLIGKLPCADKSAAARARFFTARHDFVRVTLVYGYENKTVFLFVHGFFLR